MAARKAGMATGTTVASINVKVSPDTTKFRSELKGKLEEIEKTLKADIEVNSHFANPAQTKADFKRFMAQLRADGDKGIKVKANVEYDKGKVPSPGGGKGGGGGSGGGGNKTGIFGFPSGGGGFSPGKLIPNFGSGINPAGYVAILGAFALVAAPLIGLLTTAILTIPGLISAIATPFMAISLGLEGIKNAAAGSGLFSLDDKGKIDGLGAVFDPIKTEVSKAFDEGLAPSFKRIAAAIQPLLGSLPQVATGLSDMFRGFTDALTSTEGMALFDQTIKNIGEAMSASAPGIRDFTTGMMGLATSFTAQLPAFSGWLNRTGDSFVKWVQEMTTIPDPAGHHGPDPNGKSPLDQAFVGLGDTLRTIGDWAVNMAEAGLKFVSDPTKMDGFLVTLDKIGQAITKLVDLGNRLGPVWDLADKILPGGDQLPNVPGNQPKIETPKYEKPPAGINPEDAGWKPENAQDTGGFVGFLRDFAKDLTGLFSGHLFDSDGTIKVGEKFVSKSAGNDKLQGVINTELPRINAELDKLQSLTADWLNDGTQPNRVEGYRTRMAELKTQLAEIQTLQEQLSPQVALKSSESPLSVAEGGKGTVVDQLLAGLTKVPAAAATAKTALQQVQDTGVLTPEALGELSQPAQPIAVPKPDTSALQQIPQEASTAMQGVTEAVTTGGAEAATAATGVGDQIVAAMSGMSAQFQSVGFQMMNGVATGISEGKSLAIGAAASAAAEALAKSKEVLGISSPSRKFMEVGDYSMQGLAIGMQNGFQPVLDQAKDLSGKITDAFNNGSDPTGFLEGFSDKEASRMEKVLNYQQKLLGFQADEAELAGRTADAESARAEAKKLGRQKASLDLAQDFAELQKPEESDWKGPIAKIMNGMAKAPFDFAGANAKQFMSDIGMSGGGALGGLMDYGQGLASSFVFNVGNMEDALTAQQTLTNRQAQGVLPR